MWNNEKRGSLFLFISVFLASFFPLTTAAMAEGAVIIVNSSVPDQDITKEDLKNIFLGYKTKWSDHSDVSVVISQKRKILHESFLLTYIDKNPEQFDRAWKMVVFTGKGSPPYETNTGKDTIEFVSKTKGSIGYIYSNEKIDSVRIVIPK